MKKMLFVTIILTAVSILRSAFLFVQLVELMVRIVKLYAGLRAFGGMLALIPLSILELSFVIAVGPHYSKHARIGNLWGPFFDSTRSFSFSSYYWSFSVSSPTDPYSSAANGLSMPSGLHSPMSTLADASITTLRPSGLYHAMYCNFPFIKRNSATSPLKSVAEPQEMNVI